MVEVLGVTANKPLVPTRNGEAPLLAGTAAALGIIMTVSAKLVMLLLCTAGLVGAHAQNSSKAPDADQTQLEEEALIVIDEEPEAFFEYASRSMSDRMNRALSQACDAVPRSAFCGSTPLRFLRAVSVYGRKQQYGFACAKDKLYARNKYFVPEDIRTRSHCVFVDCTFRGGRCEVDQVQLSRQGDA
jgi:hypothetical protein